jgi:2'-5' RNA ligase
MPNKNNYVAFQLDNTIIEQYYMIGQEINKTIDNFSPFELDQIHMTVCFLGDLSKKIKINGKKILEQLDISIKTQPETSSLEFDSFELFGTKNNLIVARFKISNKEREKIIQFKKYCSDNYGAPLEDYFTPHITLGKILHFNESNCPDLFTIQIPRPKITKLGTVSMKLMF